MLHAVFNGGSRGTVRRRVSTHLHCDGEDLEECGQEVRRVVLEAGSQEGRECRQGVACLLVHRGATVLDLRHRAEGHIGMTHQIRKSVSMCVNRQTVNLISPDASSTAAGNLKYICCYEPLE